MNTSQAKYIRKLQIAKALRAPFPSFGAKLLGCCPIVCQDGVLTPQYREPFAWLALAAHTLTSQEAPDPADRRLPEIRGG